MEARKGHWTPGDGVRGGCKPPDKGAGNSGPLQEHFALLIPQQSPQPYLFKIIKRCGCVRVGGKIVFLECGSELTIQAQFFVLRQDLVDPRLA